MIERMPATREHDDVFRHHALIHETARRIVLTQCTQHEVDIARAQSRDERFISALVGHDGHARILRGHARDSTRQDQRSAERQRADRDIALNRAPQSREIIGDMAQFV